MMHDRTEYQGRVDGDKVELGIICLVSDKIARGLFGQRLGGAIGDAGVVVDVGESDGVPRVLSKGGGRVGQLGGVEDGGEGGGDDNTLDGGRGVGNGFEDTGRANDGRVNEIFLGIG